MSRSTRVRLFLRESVPIQAREVQQTVLARLQALEAAGVVDEFGVDTWDHRAREGGVGTDPALTAYRVFEHWASSHGLTLAPAFDEHRCRNAYTDEAYTTTTLPVLCLAIYENGRIQAVYPHRGPGGTKTVADGLAMLEAELPPPTDQFPSTGPTHVGPPPSQL